MARGSFHAGGAAGGGGGGGGGGGMAGGSFHAVGAGGVVGGGRGPGATNPPGPSARRGGHRADERCESIHGSGYACHVNRSTPATRRHRIAVSAVFAANGSL